MNGVLRGKMSFVGPRPDVPGYKEYFKNVSQNKCNKTLTVFTYDKSSREKLVSRMVSLTDQHYEEMLENICVNVFETKNDSERINQYMGILKNKCKPEKWWNRFLTKIDR